MAKKTHAFAPQQERSRQSLRRLLKAAAEVLGLHGVDGATIPRIAQHAGLTPGAIYRRFHDKEALLEEVVLGILQRQEERLKAGMAPETAAQIPLHVFAQQVIGGMVVAYRHNAALLRAMRMFILSRSDTPFWKKACRLEARSYQRAVDLFLAHRKEIRHPDPQLAVSTGLMMVISMLFEIIVMSTDLGPWKSLMPRNDQELKRELTRAFLSYLDVQEKAR